MAKVLLLGSDYVSHRTVQAMLQAGFKKQRLTALCVQPSERTKPSNPLPQFINYLQSEGIPMIPFENNWEALTTQNQQEIGIVASFGHMVPDSFIDSFPKGMLVMHPSLLPKYRGACPLQHAILNRESETGVSVIQISKGKFDAGKVLLQSSYPLKTTTKFDQL